MSKISIMKIKVGDKVKFLNENGGGIVSRIIDSKTVDVTIEDGFEIPTFIGNLIVIEPSSSDSARNLFDTDFDIKIPEEKTIQQEETPEDTPSALLNFSSLTKLAKGVYLAFIPQNQQFLLTGNIDLFIINHSNFEILYNFHHKENNSFKGFDFGSVSANSKLLLQTFEREELVNWLNGNVQILFHSEKIEKILLPADSNFNIKGSRFFKEENYKSYSFIEERSLIFTVCEITSQVPIEENLKSKNILQSQSKMKEAGRNDFIDKHKIDEETAEIDLHIGEIKKEFSHLSKIEILNIQLNYFEKCLESALANRIKKLVVIHGVGQGILKSEIRKAFDKYNIEYYDASIAKYGVGATEGVV